MAEHCYTIIIIINIIITFLKKLKKPFKLKKIHWGAGRNIWDQHTKIISKKSQGNQK